MKRWKGLSKTTRHSLPSGIRTLLVALFILLGIASYAHSQNVVTTTTFRTVTIPATTLLTTITIGETTQEVRIELPPVTFIAERRVPDMACIVTFTAQQPPSVIVISYPGTTIRGTTTTATFPATLRTFTTTQFETVGWTTTRTGIEAVPITTEVLGFTTALPLPAYGIGVEICGPATITHILTYVFEADPRAAMMTVKVGDVAIPGFTQTIPNMGLVTTTATFTITRTYPGTTESFSTRFSGLFHQTISYVQPTIEVRTITKPGTTYVETYTTVVTLEQTITKPATTTPHPTATTPTTTLIPTTTPTETRAAEPIATNTLLLAVAAATFIGIVIGVLLAVRR
jgi:hypothetical protein